MTPVSFPPLTAFAHALNCTSQDRWIAAALFTNVLPLTENGRVASPVLIMAGAWIPPMAPLDEADDPVAVDDAAAAEEEVAVLFENGAMEDEETLVGSEEEIA